MFIELVLLDSQMFDTQIVTFSIQVIYCNVVNELLEAHLTNVSLQKHTEEYDQNHGGKWDLRRLKLFLVATYGEDIVN